MNEHKISATPKGQYRGTRLQWLTAKCQKQLSYKLVAQLGYDMKWIIKEIVASEFALFTRLLTWVFHLAFTISIIGKNAVPNSDYATRPSLPPINCPRV